MEVSRSRFYVYLNRLKRPDDPDLLASKTRIKAIFKEHRGKYGSRRILKQLKADSHPIGRYKVRRLMRELGLKAKAPKRYKVTTDSRHSFPVAPNLLNRKFDVDEPNRFWATDITYSACHLKAGCTWPWCLIYTPARSSAGPLTIE